MLVLVEVAISKADCTITEVKESIIGDMEICPGSANAEAVQHPEAASLETTVKDFRSDRGMGGVHSVFIDVSEDAVLDAYSVGVSHRDDPGAPDALKGAVLDIANALRTHEIQQAGQSVPCIAQEMKPG